MRPVAVRAAIPVRLDASALLAFALAVWTFADALLPEAAPGHSASSYWTAATLAALLSLVSVAVHELGHCVGAWRAGLAVERVTLSLFGGVTELQKTTRSPRLELRVVAGGPLASLAVAGVSALLHVVLVEAAASPLGAAVLALVAIENLALVVVHLVPAPPLDGGHALHALVWALTARPVLAARVAAALARVTTVALVLVAVLASVWGNVPVALWTALASFTVWRSAGDAR